MYSVKTKRLYSVNLNIMSINGLQAMETFYMALADKTRLRLLNLMKDDEICVCFFTEVLGESQPKISRHLAYLRNAGIVTARRDGKWMHYSINDQLDVATKGVLNAALTWLETKHEMLADREKYNAVCCSPDALVQIARTPMPFIYRSPYVSENKSETSRPHHNELEEFLL